MNTKSIARTSMAENEHQKFKVKCPISWCQNVINVFDFHVGHVIPESKGGATTTANLKPICARCNLSMSNSYTITQFSNEFAEIPKSTCTAILLLIYVLIYTCIYNEIVRII